MQTRSFPSRPEGRSPAGALRQAQISIRNDKRWRSPYYWSGFVLQGSWEPASRRDASGLR